MSFEIPPAYIVLLIIDVVRLLKLNNTSTCNTSKAIEKQSNIIVILFSTYIINKNSKSYRKVSLEVYAQICILHYECGYGIAKLQDQFPHLPKATMYRLMKRFIGNTEHHKMIKRNKWQIMRNMKNFNKVIGIFSLVELQDHVGLASRCSNCTIRCFLNRIITIISINVEGKEGWPQRF